MKVWDSFQASRTELRGGNPMVITRVFSVYRITPKLRLIRCCAFKLRLRTGENFQVVSDIFATCRELPAPETKLRFTTPVAADATPSAWTFLRWLPGNALDEATAREAAEVADSAAL